VRVDTPGYRHELWLGRQPRLPLSEHLRHAIMQFQVLIAEDVARFERKQYTIPSYISMARCPPDITMCPEYYEV
jgi:hypothetical protein